jgi:hypothetical protein
VATKNAKSHKREIVAIHYAHGVNNKVRGAPVLRRTPDTPPVKRCKRFTSLGRKGQAMYFGSAFIRVHLRLFPIAAIVTVP